MLACIKVGLKIIMAKCARPHCGGGTQSSIAQDATRFIAASLSKKLALARPCSVAHKIICAMYIAGARSVLPLYVHTFPL